MDKDKIKSQSEIVEVVKTLKKQRKKIVTCNGSFDVLHKGHFQKIKECKEQGDVLILCLNSDKSIKSYKGPDRPINSEIIRVKNLARMDEIDYLVIFDEINPKKILNKVKPDVHCVGKDWGKYCVEAEAVERNGGKIYVSKWLKGFSTSKIVNVHSVRAVFLDRDGVININKLGYVHRIEDFKFTPFAITALQKLSQTDFKIIIATNQSGIARGYYTEKDLAKLHGWLLDVFKDKGIRIDKIYYCPHHPTEGKGKHKQNCSCRKPKPGMIEKAAKDFGINLSKSWIIGDREKDILAGKEANLRTILMGKQVNKIKTKPHYQVKNLLEAVQIILNYD